MRIIVILTNDNVRRIYITAEPYAYIRTFVRQITGRQQKKKPTKSQVAHNVANGTENWRRENGTENWRREKRENQGSIPKMQRLLPFLPSRGNI